MMKLNIPEAAAAVIAALERCGYEAFAVGGCVRDAILGRKPNDWDVTTSAHPDKTLEIFSSLPDFKAIPTGIAHGTVTVVYQKTPIEVTTYRIDGEYSDSRHPDSVNFTDSIAADLARRDFTVNAMAYSDERGLVDPYGGVRDLEAGIIRCVGSPRERFSEDALRILRALRFSSVLGFTVEADTANAAVELKSLLTNISRERIGAEIAKLVCGRGAARVVKEFLPVIREIMPDTNFGGIDMICASLGHLSEPSVPLALAALLADSEANIVTSLRSLRLDNATITRCSAIVSHLHDELCGEVSLKRLCRDVGYDAALDTVRLQCARGECDARLIDTLLNIAKRGDCVSLSQLMIGGDELLSLGAAPREIGKTLADLLDRVISGELQNNKKTLLFEAERIITRKDTHK